MLLTSNVSHSGLNAQNAHRLKDIQRAEGAVSSYYNSQGGTTKRTSHWNIDDEGNVSHFAYVRREDKLNEKLRKEADENAKKLIEKIREDEGVHYKKQFPILYQPGLRSFGIWKSNLAVPSFL